MPKYRKKRSGGTTAVAMKSGTCETRSLLSRPPSAYAANHPAKTPAPAAAAISGFVRSTRPKEAPAAAQQLGSPRNGMVKQDERGDAERDTVRRLV
jgi:hypothetical protein